MAEKNKNRIAFSAKDIALISVLTAILFVQEEALSFIPNVQLTVFLLVLYSKKLGFVKTAVIILIHVFLDNIITGSLNPAVVSSMLVGWMLTPTVICTLGKKTENPIFLALLATGCSFLYSWAYVLPMYLFYSIQPIAYLAADITFELILAGTGAVSTAVLYKPCSKLFKYCKVTSGADGQHN